MTVAEVIESAKYSELQQLGVVQQLSNADPAIVEQAEKHVLSYVNAAVTELYKRFTLRTEETVITLNEGQTIYTLSNANVFNAISNPSGYLDKFDGEFINILAIFDEQGQELSINKEADPLTVLTPNFNSIQVPNPIDNEQMYIIYGASPDRIVWTNDLTAIDIPIPVSMVEALLLYVGYKGHVSINGDIKEENNTHLMRFEASCAKIRELGLITDDGLVLHSVQSKGFV